MSMLEAIAAQRKRVYVFTNATAQDRSAELEAAGAAMTTARKAALDNFHIAKDAASATWGPKLLNLWMPVTGVVAACAIDVVAGVTGTFFGSGVYGAAGWVMDGSTTYFRAYPDISTVLTANNAHLGGLFSASPTTGGRWMSVQTGANAYAEGDCDGVAVRFYLGENNNAYRINNSAVNGYQALRGFITLSRTASNLFIARRRTEASVLSFGTNTGTQSQPNFTASRPLEFGRRANETHYLNGTLAMMYAGTGLTDTEVDAMTSALKTLYQNFTGNPTIPS